MNLFKNETHFSIVEEIKQEIFKNKSKFYQSANYRDFVQNNPIFKNESTKKEIIDRLIYDKNFLKNIVEDDYFIAKTNHYFTEKTYQIFSYFIIENLSYFKSQKWIFHPDTFLKPLLESHLINFYSNILSKSINNKECFLDKDKEVLDNLEDLILKNLLNNCFSHITTSILFLSKEYQKITNRILDYYIDGVQNEKEKITLSSLQEENIKTFAKRYEQDKNDINTFIGFYLTFMKDGYYSFDLVNFIKVALNSNDMKKYDLFKAYKEKNCELLPMFLNSSSLSKILHEDIFLYLNIYTTLCPLHKDDIYRVDLMKKHFPRSYNRHIVRFENT